MRRHFVARPVCEVLEELPPETVREPLASLDGALVRRLAETAHSGGALGRELEKTKKIEVNANRP